MPVLLVPLVIVFASAAVAALFWLTPLAGRLSITRLAWLLALAPLAAFVLLLSFIPAIPNEQALTWSFEWIPALGLHVGLYFDNLSALFALIVTGIGMLVVVYAGYYFKETRALTPTLSQGERGPELPLPMGEGRGEGNQKSVNHHHLHTIKCRKIGVIESTPGLRLSKSGAIKPFNSKGYEHFS
jgi:hypothetical protein